MSTHLRSYAETFQQAESELLQLSRPLADDQFNWKPDDTSWSIGEWMCRYVSRAKLDRYAVSCYAKPSRCNLFFLSPISQVMKATANFDITGWDSASSDQPDAGPELSRVVIRKTFQGGDIEGESEGEGLFCGMSDPETGAGYVVSERVTGQLGDRRGSFVIQHGGLMGPGLAPRTFGHVVLGSGPAIWSASRAKWRSAERRTEST